jgi:hypothetical protein
MKSYFQEGAVYRYADLMHSLEGGSQQFYLPFKDQQVYAALLTPQKNPDAPHVVLVGSKPRVAIAGAIFSRQQTPVPTFVKKTTNQWVYCGRYRAAEVTGKAETAALAKKAARSDVAFALRLEKVEVDVGQGADSGLDRLRYVEGASGQVTRNVYERNPEARAACLRHYGLRCCVCGIAFREEYGDRGGGFIHVHHLEPLSGQKHRMLTDPVTDLVPVCPNCHAMLHAGRELITPKDLQHIYWSEASGRARQARSGVSPKLQK